MDERWSVDCEFSIFFTDERIGLKQTKFVSSEMLFLNYFTMIAICPAIC